MSSISTRLLTASMTVILVAVISLAFVQAAASSPSQQFPPPQWKKTCYYGTVGSEACTVTLEMQKDPGGSPNCGTGVNVYCLNLKVSCPADVPEGDPGENCETGWDCNICGNTSPAVCLTCDGQNFCVAPSNGGNWDGVADDCGNGNAYLN